MPEHTYYKELTAPAGYALDSSVQSFTVTDGQNTALSVSDTPTNDPVRISINKVDSETGDKVQGGASLENAEFTVKYYAGYYNAGNLPANATRTWVIKTVKIGGVYVAGLNNTCKVSGDDFYTNAAGTAILPLGTISIEETKAPEGYSLEGAYLQVGGTGTKITGKYVAQITQNGNLAQLKGGNTFKVSDKIKRGDFKLTKIDTDNQNRMSDIPFRVTCKGTGESHIIKTDENGYKLVAKNPQACLWDESHVFLIDFYIDWIYNICINRKDLIQMGRPKSNNVQINISIPLEWKIELENLARIYSVEEGKTITFLDLMRRGIKEKYQLGENDDE